MTSSSECRTTLNTILWDSDPAELVSDQFTVVALIDKSFLSTSVPFFSCLRLESGELYTPKQFLTYALIAIGSFLTAFVIVISLTRIKRDPFKLYTLHLYIACVPSDVLLLIEKANIVDGYYEESFLKRAHA
ncbi:unnamed protein product [Toxocara canis]|nr:unnamed protein product [Toxocara canis]